jgi:hypothetical protein
MALCVALCWGFDVVTSRPASAAAKQVQTPDHAAAQRRLGDLGRGGESGRGFARGLAVAQQQQQRSIASGMNIPAPRAPLCEIPEIVKSIIFCKK